MSATVAEVDDAEGTSSEGSTVLPFSKLSPCRPLPFPRPQSLRPISYDLQGGSVRNATATWAAVASGLADDAPMRSATGGTWSSLAISGTS
jgi:hypothetical protein